MAQNIVVTQIDGSQYTTRPMAVCSTAAATAAKTVDYGGDFSLVEGATIIVRFTNGNTASNPTLNVDNTGAKGLYCRGNYLLPSMLNTGTFYELVYDGTYWQILGAVQDHYKNIVSTQNGTDTSGTEITIPVITTNSYGHVTKVGTRKHTVAVQKISKFCTIAGGQNKDKYFYIGSVLCNETWSGYHANLSFVGAESVWSGILYFGFRLGGKLTEFSGVELKWLSLTRPDVSDKIVMTYTDETEGRRVHLYFKYPADYLTTSISIISEGESNPKPFVFNGAVSSSPIGTVYKISSIDSNSSGLETTVFALIAENQRQAQQINDLKSTIESIITGKTWDSNIWGGSSETTTGENGGAEVTTPGV